MIILPAIDLHEGKCVRLLKGDYATAHKVAEDAVETARSFLAAGASMIHMVDLDGAKSGERVNEAIIRRVVDETGLKVEMGGGIRSMEDIAALDTMGIYRFIIGSAAVERPEFVGEAVRQYGADRVAVSLDCRDGIVMTAGWLKNSGRDYLKFAVELEAMGLRHIIFTDIETDGTLKGPALGSLQKLKDRVSCKITASGGVGTLEDVRALKELGVDGVIIGKAIYTGGVDLAAAIKLAAGQ